ncbi:keratin-associated protein 14-like [Cavia porcellus]|uniref:keratin-associated protein 14-like n=1 Tax=Cavia porcellus TaxID=10141 RepID=UPI000184D611|nr:keratin-associated protein 14-like [Cavia porcellus]
MSCGCSSGNFSSRSFSSVKGKGDLQYPSSSCGSSYPSKLVYSTELQTPITYQLDSPLYSGCQETFSEPFSCQRSYVVSQFCPKISTLGNTCQTSFSGPLSFGSRGVQSFGYGYPSLGFGSTGFHSVGCGPRTISFLNSGSNFYCPAYFSSRSFQSTSFQPTCRSGFY